ncbi:lysophospholipase [Aldersonia sp. NBC_00410]|uniref:alpha/beta hydrolase n=1 Tax=Aldersonia sp. NBC_00410 TaxID=2975954 RepID=UPI002250064E|nr:alpha/beta hydrolase [Aldersonia sp. NBC_00410]MCX5042628.1 lysophospholipase [Aldersonia sp. NBC_00410]
MTATTHGEFAGAAGMIRWQGWLPDGPATALVVVVHGLGEHAGRYAWVAEQLAAKGYAVYAPDHQGHGLSDGTRANIDSMDGVADDVGTMLAEATRRHPDVPRFLLGHSLGGLITLYYVTRRPVELAGVVLSAPAADPGAVSAVEKIAARVLSRVAPNLGVLQLDATTVSRDPEVVQRYIDDPLVHSGKIPARTVGELLAAFERMQPRLAQLQVPLLVMHGTADALVSPDATKLVADAVGTSDLTVKYYDGLYHELLNEPEREQVLDEVLTWLDGHR